MQEEIICGIDPGLKGAYAVIRGRSVLETAPLPKIANRIDAARLWGDLQAAGPDLVVIERQVIRQAQAGALTIGSNFGRLLAVVELLGLPHRLTTPLGWRKLAGLGRLQGRKDPEASYDAALRRFGAIELGGLHPKRDEARIEALLIAAYGAGAGKGGDDGA